MAQVGGVLAFKSTKSAEGQLVFFLGIDRAKFRRPVYPGDQLRIEVEVLQERPPFWKLKGMAYVDGKLVAEAELKAMLGRGGDADQEAENPVGREGGLEK